MTHPIPHRILTALMIALGAVGLQGQRPAPRGLRIVVIEGEDAVNVIQQKTAVRPLIELRDYNDLPVGGATVTFSIMGGRATFAGGVPQITVTTDAAGRAAAALNPLSNGQVSIRIEAAFQGQTATATVSQTNVATAAEAARVANQGGGASGSAGTTGAAAGGGLSGAAIAGIVGGIAAGAGLGLKAAGGGGNEGGTGGGGGGNAGGGGPGGGGGGTSPPQCTFTVSPESIATNSEPSTTTVTVSAQPAGCTSPMWSASTTATFFSLGGGPAQGPVTGSSSFGVSIRVNQSGVSRSGTVTLSPIGRTIQVAQMANCTFTVMPTSFGNIPGLATSDQVAVMLANSPCDPQTWTAFSNTPQYVSVSPTSGSGSGLVTVTFTQHGPNAAGPRPVSVTIAGHTIAGSQQVAGSSTTPCQTRTWRGGDIAGMQTFELDRAAGAFLLTYDTGDDSADRIVVRNDGQVVFDTGCVRTMRPEARLVRYAGASSQVTVQVMPNCAGGTGTSWAVEVACPR